jgi:hypothetical protein
MSEEQRQSAIEAIRGTLTPEEGLFSAVKFSKIINS